MKKGIIFIIFALFLHINIYSAVTDRITVNGTQFSKCGQRVWMNGANTPWDNWNDFGGTYDGSWWDTHYGQFNANGLNSSRVWITCSGEVGINIDTTGYVSGATAAHWNNLDDFFAKANNRGVYIMATLISFDHFKNTYTTYQRWRNWINSDANIDSYIDNYLIPFVNRYKDNPALWSIDLTNEPEWATTDEGGTIAWARFQTFWAKAAKAIHDNSQILVTVGIGVIKYNSDNAGMNGNKVSDAALQARLNDPAAKLDYYSPHWYSWMDPYWSILMYTTPASFGINTKPCVVGESTALGTTGHTLTQDNEAAYTNGWQGFFPWTSNGVDTYGNWSNVQPAANTFKNNHNALVFPVCAAGTPTRTPTTGPTPQQVIIYDGDTAPHRFADGTAGKDADVTQTETTGGNPGNGWRTDFPASADWWAQAYFNPPSAVSIGANTHIVVDVRALAGTVANLMIRLDWNYPYLNVANYLTTGTSVDSTWRTARIPIVDLLSVTHTAVAQVAFISNNNAAYSVMVDNIRLEGAPAGTPTLTRTSTRTNTPVPPTATFTRTATGTNTPVPPTATFTRTATRTNTPVPPTATFTRTATGTNTPVPSTPTFTQTATRTNTVVLPTVTFTRTNTPDVTGSQKEYCLNINYGAVPSYVNKRKLTLKVNVGNCSAVSVTADGILIPSAYKPATGEAVFTTSGNAINITALNWVSGGTGAAVKAYLQDDKHWAYSQTFDDMMVDVVTNAKPLLDARGWKAGIATVATWAGASWGPNLTWAQMQSLVAEGWDIYNHSYTHPNLSCANFQNEFDQNQAAFTSNLPGYKVNHIVYPYEDTAAVACAGFPGSYLLSGEAATGGVINYVDAPFANVYRIARGGQYGTNNAQWKADADSAAAAARPGWVIKITHHVYPGSAMGADTYSTTAAALGDFYNHLYNNYGAGGNNSMWFAPAGEVMDFILTRDNAVVSSCSTATPTRTRTATRTPTMTNTAVPPTSTFTRTATVTVTVTVTNSPVPPTVTFTRTATGTLTPSFTPTNTNTVVVTPSNTPAGTLTNTPVLSATFTATATFTNTPVPPVPTLTRTATGTLTPYPITPSFTPTQTNTIVVTPSNTPVVTPTFTATGTPTKTNTIAVTPSNTPQGTLTNSPTPAATASSSSTPVITATFTATGTLTPYPATPSFTATATLTNVPSGTSTATPSRTATRTATPSRTSTPSSTRTVVPNTPTITPTYTATAVPDGTVVKITKTDTNPNPFNIKTGSAMTVSYYVTKRCAKVTFTLYTLSYRKIMTIEKQGPISAGDNSITIAGGALAKLSAGVYYGQVTATDEQGAKTAGKAITILIIR